MVILRYLIIWLEFAHYICRVLKCYACVIGGKHDFIYTDATYMRWVYGVDVLFFAADIFFVYL